MNPILPADPALEASPILIVDDDATNLEVLRQTLAGKKYRLHVARTGEDAIAVARRARPQVVLLDVLMPGIDGYETCRRLKQDPDTRTAAVIFLSALVDVKDKIRGFEAGAVDFISKPFEADEVIARVDTHLAIQRVLRQPAALPVDETYRGEPRAQVAAAAGADSPPASGFEPGDVVAFRFRIVQYLARGGMGELFEAEDLELHERVALKTILSSVAQTERATVLFKREVHLARQVTHPNVCRIYDVFRHRLGVEAGQPREVMFLAMELLHGETLAATLKRRTRFEVGEVLPLVRQMGAGLSAAHRAGVVHRDFKTHNVMLVPTPDGEMRAVVTDFGLAQRTAGNEATCFSLSSTGEDEISGTPAYMAPEQVEGMPLTPAADVYAFGVVLYELTTGVRPFVADTPMKTAMKRLQEAPLPPTSHVPGLDPQWDAAIMRCLARQPADRFPTINDVLAALEPATVASPPAQSATRRPFGSARRRLAALLALVAMAVGSWWYVGRQAADGLTSVAVLPFRDPSGDEEQQMLSEGLSESLIDQLSRLPGIRVVAHSSSSRYKGEDASAQEVARVLRVDAILVGRVARHSDRLSISVELIDGRDGRHVWGQTYAQSAAALQHVAAAITGDVTGELDVQGPVNARIRDGTAPAASARAYELLLKGHKHRARGTTTDRQIAGDYFRQAIAADPTFAAAYADLSDIYRSLINSGHLPAAEYLPRARAAAHTALDLDADLAEGHYALANLMSYDWDWSGATREYRRAIELNPNLALAHRWYATHLRLLGRHDQAVAEITRAQDLDPLSPGVSATVGFVLAAAQRYDDAMLALEKARTLDPTYPYAPLYVGHVRMARGHFEQAAAAYQQAADLGLDTPTTKIWQGAAYARLGLRDRANAILAQVRRSDTRVSPAELAILLAALGQREQALDSLEQAYRERDHHLQNLAVDDGFDPLRTDPRFRELLRRIGLTS